jgi:hypothetical protein
MSKRSSLTALQSFHHMKGNGSAGISQTNEVNPISNPNDTYTYLYGHLGLDLLGKSSAMQTLKTQMQDETPNEPIINKPKLIRKSSSKRNSLEDLSIRDLTSTLLSYHQRRKSSLFIGGAK